MIASPGKISFHGKLALVTGAGLRLGKAIAEDLARCGAQVAVHYLKSKEAAQNLALSLGQESFAVSADLRDLEQIEKMIYDVKQKSQHQGIDFLVNNASAFVHTPFENLSDKDWQEMINVNLTAPMRCIRSAMKVGLSAVVNLVDIAAWQPWNKFSAYGCSKAGLLHLTKILAKELAPRVRVNAVAPGTILLPDHDDTTHLEKILPKIPMGRTGLPQEVARAVRFLLEEPYLTGVCLPVDGGQGLR